MIPHLFYSHLVVLGLLWLCVMLHYIWPSRGAVAPPQAAASVRSSRPHSHEPKPFTGLAHKPPRALCEQEAAHPKPPPPGHPKPMLPSHRRPRAIDTSPWGPPVWWGWGPLQWHVVPSSPALRAGSHHTAARHRHRCLGADRGAHTQSPPPCSCPRDYHRP
jgi:hypothetical protein